MCDQFGTNKKVTVKEENTRNAWSDQNAPVEEGSLISKIEGDNFFTLIFKNPKLSSIMKSDQDSDLWNFLHLDHPFLLC